jgi:hypothetical protein
MAESTFRRFYRQAEFLGMAGNPVDPAQFATFLTTLPLSEPVADVRVSVQGIVGVEWADLPTQNDLDILDNAVATFAAAPTTDQPFELNSFAATTATTAALVDKINFTTPPLAAGTYQVLWTSMLRMVAAVANTGVRGVMTLARQPGNTQVQQESNWDLAQKIAFNGGLTFQVTAGQTISALLQLNKLGAAAATAEMSGARVTIDKIA